ncbi:MAG TPA: TolC family protein [Vicinamibacterales bacterium]|nr:TolC family protein [Vicinamibacterales bacterium]
MTQRWAILGLVVLLVPAAAAAQPAGTRETLSLDTAIGLAVANNRQIRAARLQVDRDEDDLAAARTRRLPAFETTMLGSQLLTPVQFSFPKAAFGDFPGIGPVPATDTSVTTPQRPTLLLTSQVTQPLSQLIRINLGIRGAEATRELDREHARDQELTVVNTVKRLYFAILQNETAIAASDEAIATYRELDRTLELRVAQRIALRGDALDVQARLAQEELTRLSRANALESQKEQLNQLLGRDVRTEFDTAAVADISILDVDLRAAQGRALDRRPDVRQARLKAQQAEIDRRMKKAEWIPDVGLAVSYNSNFNLDVMPKNLASAGVQVKWEPFDWGRKGRELASKSHAVEQAQLAVRETEDHAVVEVNDRFRKLGEAKALLKVADTSRTAAREKLRVKTNQFQIEAAVLSDVLHLRADLADATDRYQQALSNFWTSKADFERAIGEDLIQ